MKNYPLSNTKEDNNQNINLLEQGKNKANKYKYSIKSLNLKISVKSQYIL